MFFEQGMRGGFIYINKRYSEASKNVNILYLDTNTWIFYMDALWSKWVKNIHKIKQKLINIKNNSSARYVLEVKLRVSKKITWYS